MFTKFKKLKIFLFMIFSVSSFYALDSNTKKLLKEDCEYLYYCWTNGYIVNKSLETNGFNVKEAILRIEKNYPKQEKFTLKKFPDKMVYENGIDKFSLSVLIHNNLYEKNNIKDSHYLLNSGSMKFGLAQNKTYFSDLYFIKDNNGLYTVTGDNIYNGKNYTGNPIFLKKCVHENKEMFRYISLSDKTITEVTISLDGKDFLFPVHQEKIVRNSESNLDYQVFDDTLYIKLKTCSFDNNEDYLSFLNFLDSIKNIKKSNIIIDFRDNLGGIRKIPYELLMSLFCENSDDKIAFEKCIDFAERDVKKIISPLTVENTQSKKDIKIYSSENNTDFSTINYSKNNQLDDYFLESNIKINSKIYILMNNRTASAAEMGIACTYLLGKENIVLIGENSNGCADYAEPFTYILPNSKLEITLCSCEFKDCLLLKNNQNYLGDSFGFFPDYWSTNDDLNMLLQYLTKDNSISIDLEDD